MVCARKPRWINLLFFVDNGNRHQQLIIAIPKCGAIYNFTSAMYSSCHSNIVTPKGDFFLRITLHATKGMPYHAGTSEEAADIPDGAAAAVAK